jgi:hypothetical protein
MSSKEILILIVFALVVIVLVIGVFGGPPEPTNFIENRTVSNYSTMFFEYEIVRYPSNVEIKHVDAEGVILGFVTEPWNLNFGINPGNGSYSTRTIVLTNKEEKSIKVSLKSYGNISSMIVFGKNDFVLEPKKNVSLDIFLYSKNNEPGNYSGEIDVITKKPIYNFLPIN